MNNCVKDTAFKDITEWMRSLGIKSRGKKDVWVVAPYRMDTKKTRWLNKKLGLHRLNMARKKK